MLGKKDVWKPIVIEQGYVPEGCTLNGAVVWALINKGEDPCSGCNEERGICKGRAADPKYLEKRLAEKHSDS